MKQWFRNLGMAIVYLSTKWAVFVGTVFLILHIFEADLSYGIQTFIGICVTIAGCYWLSIFTFKQWDAIGLLLGKKNTPNGVTMS